MAKTLSEIEREFQRDFVLHAKPAAIPAAQTPAAPPAAPVVPAPVVPAPAASVVTEQTAPAVGVTTEPAVTFDPFGVGQSDEPGGGLTELSPTFGFEAQSDEPFTMTFESEPEQSAISSALPEWKPVHTPLPVRRPEPKPAPVWRPVPAPVPEVEAAPESEIPAPAPTPEPVSEPAPEPDLTQEPVFEYAPEVTPNVTPEPEPEPEAVAEPEPTPEPEPEQTPEPAVTEKPQAADETRVAKAETAEAAVDKKAAGRKTRRRIGNVVFYLALALIIAGAVIFRSVGGYSFYSVLSPSMQSEIPQGSLVVVKKTDPTEINVGDDITYLREDGNTVTHRVISITEDFESSGERGFQTKGIENETPDPSLIYAENVVGVVVVSVPRLGTALSWVADHILITLGVLVVIVILFISLKTFSTEQKKDRASKAAEIAAVQDAPCETDKVGDLAHDLK